MGQIHLQGCKALLPPSPATTPMYRYMSPVEGAALPVCEPLDSLDVGIDKGVEDILDPKLIKIPKVISHLFVHTLEKKE